MEKINAIAIWKRYDGDGYSFIMEYVIPILKSKDGKDTQIQNMLINNPRKILTHEVLEYIRKHI